MGSRNYFDERVTRAQQLSELRNLSAVLRSRLQRAANQQRDSGFSWRKVLNYFGKSTPSYVNVQEFIAVFRQVGRIPPPEVTEAQLQELFNAVQGSQGGGVRVGHAELLSMEFLAWLDGAD